MKYALLFLKFFWMFQAFAMEGTEVSVERSPQKFCPRKAYIHTLLLDMSYYDKDNKKPFGDKKIKGTKYGRYGYSDAKWFQWLFSKIELRTGEKIKKVYPIRRENPSPGNLWSPGCSGCVFELNNKDVIISFAGTRYWKEHPEDTWMDLNARMSYDSELGGVCHCGFLKRSKELQKNVYEALGTIAFERKCTPSELPLTFIGHSAGGPIAAVFSFWHFRKYQVKSCVYTYGSPAFFDVPTARAYNEILGNLTFDIRLKNDALPKLNPFCLTSARHVGRFLELDLATPTDHWTPRAYFISRWKQHVITYYERALYKIFTQKPEKILFSNKEDECHWNPLQKAVGKISVAVHKFHHCWVHWPLMIMRFRGSQEQRRLKNFCSLEEGSK